MIDPRNGDTGIFGRTEKPRTGSEALLLRESTAPNADRIAELERKVENLRGYATYLERRMCDDREQVRKLLQTLADSLATLWVDR